MVGGSAKDTADPHYSNFMPDESINWLVYEGLMRFSPTLEPQLMMAEEVTPNADASEWTVRLKPDLLWQDGKPVTADDVVYTFQRITDPKNPTLGAPGLGGLKPSGVKKVDNLTTTFTWETRNVLFGTDGLTQRLVHLVPKDFDPDNPIGSGPFKLTDFKPGEGFKFERNEYYHDDFNGLGGLPILDGVEVIEFADPTARVNALLGGTIDALIELPASQMEIVKANGIVPMNQKSGGFCPILMRISDEPFTDVRVRQAFRLIIDRDQVLSSAFDGVAWIGNDVAGVFDPGVELADLPQRVQDLEQARSLLKQAGYDNDLSVELVCSDGNGAGTVATAQVFAENAKSAGVDVKVNKVTADVLWGKDYSDWWTFSMDFWGYRNYLQHAAVATVPDAPWNEIDWKHDEWYALIQEGFRTIDDAKRNEIVAEAATIEYNEGGTMIPTFKNQLDAYNGDKVAGFVTNAVQGIALGGWRFNKVYFK